MDAMAKKAIQSTVHYDYEQKYEKVVRLDDIPDQHHMSNFDQTVQDLHDVLAAYYKVARKRFVDNVCMQATDHYLVTGPMSPMKLISPTWVNGLSNSQLEELVGEDSMTRRERQRLRKKIEDLEAGKKVLMT